MPINLNPIQYSAFITGITGALPILPTQLIWLGQGPAYADHWVIEAAVRNTPVRLSFKFKKNLPIRCCINLRPYSLNFGEAKPALVQGFCQWVQDHYSQAVKANDPAPYFKPFGHQPNPVNGQPARTIDTFFELNNGMCLTRLPTVKSCPEFPQLGSSIVVKLTLVEAVSRILQRLR